MIVFSLYSCFSNAPTANQFLGVVLGSDLSVCIYERKQFLPQWSSPCDHVAFISKLTGDAFGNPLKFDCLITIEKLTIGVNVHNDWVLSFACISDQLEAIYKITTQFRASFFRGKADTTPWCFGIINDIRHRNPNVNCCFFEFVLFGWHFQSVLQHDCMAVPGNSPCCCSLQVRTVVLSSTPSLV